MSNNSVFFAFTPTSEIIFTQRFDGFLNLLILDALKQTFAIFGERLGLSYFFLIVDHPLLVLLQLGMELVEIDPQRLFCVAEWSLDHAMADLPVRVIRDLVFSVEATFSTRPLMSREGHPLAKFQKTLTPSSGGVSNSPAQ